MRFKKITTSLFLMGAAVFSLMGAPQKMTGSWKAHPSFFNQVQKMADGERYTYFLVHQQPYVSNLKDYSRVRTTLFRYDKESPLDGIQSMSALYPSFPTGIISAAYSPANKALVASDITGVIWIIPDFSEPYAIYGIDNVALPQTLKINSFTENPQDGKVWIASSFGYGVIDIPEKKIENFHFTDFPIDWVSQIGDDLIFFANGKAYSAPTSKAPTTLSALTEIKSSADESSSHLLADGSLANPLSLMPLSSSSFAFLGKNPSGTDAASIGVVARNGNEWKTISIAVEAMTALGATATYTTLTDNNATPNKEGYQIQSNNNIYQLKRGINPDFSVADPIADFAQKTLSKTSKGNFASQNMVSWDGSDFWTFTPYEGFSIENNANGSWTSVVDAIWPEAPLPFIAEKIIWHPNHGILFCNHSLNSHFTTNATVVPWLLSGLKNGKWNNHTPLFTIPKVIAEDESLKSTFSRLRGSYPLCHPKGLAYNPANPSEIFVGSDLYGWARINIDDPEEVALHIGNSANSLKSLPGFFNDAPTPSSWNMLCAFTGPQFDNEGRLWMMLDDLDASKANDYSACVRYYTADELKSIRNAHDNPEEFISMHDITIMPVNEIPNVRQQLIALNNEANANYLAFFMGSYNSSIYIYDHNGTPEDTSDDRLAIFNNMHDAETGDLISLNDPYYIGEDPATGKIWASYLMGTFQIDPQLAFTDPSAAVSRVKILTDDGLSERKYLETDIVNGISTDEFGRLWIATNNRGLVCLSADRKTLLGEFNTTNSPLSTNKIYSACFSPESQSVVMSTEDGIMEFFPDGHASSIEKIVKVYPQKITPDFLGLFTVSGLPSDKNIVITDGNGNTVKNLGKSQNGYLQWDCLNENGSRPASGIYQVRSADGETIYSSFTLLN